jgi:ribonuclease HI
MTKWTVHTDGGCPQNPGPGAFGFVILTGGEKITRSGFLPMTTNNQAEYRALTAALLFLNGLAELPTEVNIFSDSELIVRQIDKTYQVKNEDLRPFYEDANAAMIALRKRVPVTLTHFKREHNVEADELCNLVLERRGIEIVSKKKIKRVAALSQS